LSDEQEHRARFDITVDGKPRSYRDAKPIAIEAATYLKTKHPHAEITVRDIEGGETIVVKHPAERSRALT
jgi:hypothetical protein